MEDTIKLSKETQELLAQVVNNWQSIKDKFIKSKEYEWSSEAESLIGHVWWDNPNLVWILVTNKEEGYDGSQSQIGVAKDGTLRWEYQSHCSCNGYEDTSELPEQFTQDTLKSFDFTYTEPPLSWEEEMRANMKTLLDSLTPNP